MPMRMVPAPGCVRASDAIAIDVVDESAVMVRVYFCWGFGSREIGGFTGLLP
jgi:hypothetical protein